MDWKKYTIDTTTAARDFICAALFDLGITGVQTKDKVPLTDDETSSMFIDFPPELGKDDGRCEVEFYIERDDPELLEKVKIAVEDCKSFVDIGAGIISSEDCADEDWENNWKEFFHAFNINDIWICPTWEEPPEEAKKKAVIKIDPGTSFGTGKHETTQLCVEALGNYVNPGCKVLDVGCGSGILAIISRKLGAGDMTLVDIDENCITSARENLDVNGILGDGLRLFAGDLTCDVDLQKKVGTDEYDVVTANILADIIIPMSDALYASVRPGGILITSGILDIKEKAVRNALEDAGFSYVSAEKLGEWVSVVMRK